MTTEEIDRDDIVHPDWCVEPLCTVERVAELALVGEHKSRNQKVVDTDRDLAVQLVQDASVFGVATPVIVWTLGAEKIEVPLGDSQALVENAVGLLYQALDGAYSPEEVEAAESFATRGRLRIVPSAREATA